MDQSIWELMTHGGAAMWVVVAFSVIALAVGIAVAVAASRVLLDVHWLTDVIAGLALGWAWFAACTVAFARQVLRPGAPRSASRSVDAPHAPGSGGAVNV